MESSLHVTLPPFSDSKGSLPGISQAVLNRVIVDKVDPFYALHGIRSGVLWWNKFKLSGHAEMLYYAGARLALSYDAASAEFPPT